MDPRRGCRDLETPAELALQLVATKARGEVAAGCSAGPGLAGRRGSQDFRVIAFASSRRAVERERHYPRGS